MGRIKGKAQILKKNQVLEHLKIEYVSVESIMPNQYNPNRQSAHEFKLLISSMREDGFTQPILVMKEGKTIVDGEHRWLAAKAIGMKEIPVVFVDMNPEQMRISTLRHNRARGSEDVELTAQILRDLQSLGALEWAQESLLMDDIEINRLIENITAPEGLAGDVWSEAWVPDLITANEIGQGTEIYQVKGSNISSAMTLEALSETRAREEALRKAKTEEEKQMIRRDIKTLKRYSFTFSGEEAKLVGLTLGTHPAEALLQLCTKAKAEGWQVNN